MALHKRCKALPEMHGTTGTRDAAKRGKSVVLPSARLMHALDLEVQAMQAHRDVGGPNFKALHILFDEVAQQAEDVSDLLAERVVSLGDTRDGRVATVASSSKLPEHPLDARAGGAHVEALPEAIVALGTLARAAVDDANDWGDFDTVDIFTPLLCDLSGRSFSHCCGAA